MTADIVLFPLDTVKTRLQSKSGFRASGGFRGIYSGILPAAAGSAPSGEGQSPVPCVCSSVWRPGSVLS